MTTLLVTDISSYKAAVLVRHIRKNWPGVRVICTDHRTYARYFHTRHARDVRIIDCNPGDADGYVRALAAMVASEAVDHVIPVNSAEIGALLERRKLLGSTLDYMGATDVFRELDDKAAFAALLKKLDLPHPRSYSSLDAPLPLVIKPVHGSSAKGVVYLNTESDRTAAKERLGPAPKDQVIQEYVAGEGVGFSGFFKDGKPVVGYAHRRVGEYPVSGGSSILRERYPYEDIGQLKALVSRLMETVPWSGFAMFEFKRRGPGDFHFIECNPRIWGSIHQGLAEGCDYFAPLIGSGKTGEPGNAGEIRTALFPLNLLAIAGYIREKRWIKVSEMFKGGWRLKADVHPLGDPLGFISLLLRGS